MYNPKTLEEGKKKKKEHKVFLLVCLADKLEYCLLQLSVAQA